MDSALKHVRQLLSRPPTIFDAFATWAALEKLCDVAREKGHDRANRFAIILRQTRPLMGSPTFQQVLLKLLGSDEEVAIAKEIQKAVKLFLFGTNAFFAFPSAFLAVIRRVISVTPYNPFTTHSWSSLVSGVFSLSFIFFPQ